VVPSEYGVLSRSPTCSSSSCSSLSWDTGGRHRYRHSLSRSLIHELPSAVCSAARGCRGGRREGDRRRSSATSRSPNKADEGRGDAPLQETEQLVNQAPSPCRSYGATLTPACRSRPPKRAHSGLLVLALVSEGTVHRSTSSFLGALNAVA
jgi:hypothetical protein